MTTSTNGNAVHVLENDMHERKRFHGLSHPAVRAEYRRLCERLTGSLPSFAQRKPAGRPKQQAARQP